MAQGVPNAFLESGDVIGQRFRVERMIGQGAMGTVYEATDTSLRRRVAVKVMLSTGKASRDESLRRRLEREARAVAQLTNEHVVRVLDVGETADGLAYYVMEYLEGRTLESIIDETGRLPPDKAVLYVREAVEAIAEAHEAGLVHRDFKPGNIFLADRPNKPPIVKVLDFGTVKEMVSNTAKLTATGATLGSPAYMAPEQIASDDPVTPSIDVWSIGVTLYELLTGELPFDGPTIPAVLQRVLHDEPPPINARLPGVPPAIESIVRRCLTKDPKKRYANAGEVRDALKIAVETPLLPRTLPDPLPRADLDVKKTVRLVGAPSAPPSSPTTAPLAKPLRTAPLEEPSARYRLPPSEDSSRIRMERDEVTAPRRPAFQVPTMPPPASSSKVGWILLVVSLAILFGIGAGGIIYWYVRAHPAPEAPAPSGTGSSVVVPTSAETAPPSTPPVTPSLPKAKPTPSSKK